jgi:signal transduction histidine kinase
VHLEGAFEPGVWVDADATRMNQVAMNLLSNALKFTPADGEVRVKLARGADRVTLTVEDTGRGIPSEHLPHIFDRFYRVPEQNPAAGPELGKHIDLRV